MTDDISSSISAYESITGLRVTIHDLSNRLWPYVDHDRFWHAHPACTTVKDGPAASRCVHFEIDRLRPALRHWPHGRIQCCHAGFVEFMVPVYHGGEVLAVLFAGPLNLIGDTASLAIHHDDPVRPAPDQGRLPEVPVPQAPHLLEGLRQLAARLRCWFTDGPIIIDAPRSRRHLIEAFLVENFRRHRPLGALARLLGVSVDRARHIVHEETGHNFSHLLQHTRLDAACARLLNTQEKVADVGARCGFPDPSHFLRVFRAQFGEPPGRWRRARRM